MERHSFDVTATYKKAIAMLTSDECIHEDSFTYAGICGTIMSALTEEERQQIAERIEERLKILERLEARK